MLSKLLTTEPIIRLYRRRAASPSCATGASRSPSAETSFVDDPKCCPVSFLWYLFTIFNRAVRSMLIVVEDDDGVRVLVEELLLDRGYDVISAQTGDEGLDRIRHEPRLSLVITDIRMPGIDGWELARRAMEVRADLKILYITGYPGEQRPDGAPPGPLLRKPWRAGEFYQCLEQLISSGDARRFDPPP